MQHLPSNWDDLARHHGAHVLQSHVWASFQAQVGREPYFAHSENFCWVGFARQNKGLRYLALPYGPSVSQDAGAAYRSVLEIAKKAKFDFVRIEPYGTTEINALKALGGRKIADVEPQYTQIIDLLKPEDELRSELESGHRNRINTAAKRGVEVNQIQDTTPLADFLTLMHDTAKHAGITNHSDSYYKTMVETMIPAGQASFYVASVDGKPVTISLVYDYHGTRYYAHTGSNQQLNRKYNAGVYLVWQMMCDAKQAGMRSFDMWGVAPSDAKGHKWAGISAFKRGFGGETVSTIGTWDIPIKKQKYLLYSTYRKLRGRE